MNGKPNPDEKTSDSQSNRESLSRRKFLGKLGKTAATVAGLGALGFPALEHVADAKEVGPQHPAGRRNEAYRIRRKGALFESRQHLPQHPTNGEEELYPNKIANFSKGLPHNSLGEVDLAAYATLIKALKSGKPADFEAITLDLGNKLTNPQSGLAFDMEGPDSHQLAQPPAPTIASAQGGGELTELYWMALARDVNFIDYENPDATIVAACTDLSKLSDFRGPKSGGNVTPDTIFRGNTAGDLVGPYLSQFLWLDIPMGALLFPQTMNTVPAGVDYLTSFNTWLAAQNGLPAPSYTLDPTPRYIRNLRDLGEWVHVDALYQAYHQACLILLGMHTPVDAGNPYKSSTKQIGFGTFGGPHILSLVTEVASRALKAVWYQKWFVHRRLRPEAFGGLVHNTISGAATYPVNAEVLNSDAVNQVHIANNTIGNNTYLLPIGAPEGCPTHPSYGAGHATVAGACVTILKAWFDESFVIANPVVPSADGTSLNAYSGPALTIGKELDKLAANVAIGRNAVGFHYRSDYWESAKLGEALAIDLLQEAKPCFNETGISFTITKFDGTTITI